MKNYIFVIFYELLIHGFMNNYSNKFPKKKKQICENVGYLSRRFQIFTILLSFIYIV